MTMRARSPRRPSAAVAAMDKNTTNPSRCSQYSHFTVCGDSNAMSAGLSACGGGRGQHIFDDESLEWWADYDHGVEATGFQVRVRQQDRGAGFANAAHIDPAVDRCHVLVIGNRLEGNPRKQR